MCDAIINGVEACFENWKPRRRYTLIDANQKPKQYNSGILI